MTALVVGLGGAVGLVAGWFIPVPAYRLSVPADEPPRAACPAGHPLPGRLSSWLRWAPSCPQCGTRCGPPAWATALVSGAACAVVSAVLGAVAVLPMYLALCVLGVLLACVDLACKRLPHALVVPASGLSLVLFVVVAALTAQWGRLLGAVVGSVALGLVFLLLYLLPGGGLGFGDVKLAVLLGLFLGWLGWRLVVLGALLPWLLNAPLVIGLLVTGRVSRRGSVPFGPAMLAGALVAIGVSAWSGLIGWS